MLIVEMRIKGRMDENWSKWFNDFQVTYSEADETILTGMVPDQAALYGLISKLRDLGIQLLAIKLSEPSLEEDLE